MRRALVGVLLTGALVVVGGPASAAEPGRLVPLGRGYAARVLADPVTGTVVVSGPRASLLLFDANGDRRTELLAGEATGLPVLDPLGPRVYVPLRRTRQIAEIDLTTLAVRRLDLPPAAGCPTRLAVASGLVFFISPHDYPAGCVGGNGYHALDPETGEVFTDLVNEWLREPYALASAGDGTLYAAERDSNDVLTTFAVSRSPRPTLTRTARTITHDSTGQYWVRDLAVTPDTKRLVVGGTAPGYQLVGPTLAYEPVQPEGMRGLVVNVAAAPGLTAYGSHYNSQPGEDDITVYRAGDQQPAARFDFGAWAGYSDSDDVEGLAIGGEHVYAVTSFWDGVRGVERAYLRVLPLPAAPPPPLPPLPPQPPTADLPQTAPVVAPAPAARPPHRRRHHHRKHHPHRHGQHHLGHPHSAHHR